MSNPPRDPLDILRELIEASHRTPGSVGVECGLHHDTVPRWLSGRRYPKANELNRALGVFNYTLTAVSMDK